MGFFNNLKEKMGGKNETKKKSTEDRISFPQTFETSNQGHFSMVMSLVKEQIVTHRDGHITNLMIAEVLNGKDNEMMLDEDKDFVAFEVAQGTQINEKILEKMVAYYLEEDYHSNQECVYIGEINGDPEDYLIKKSQSVQNYVDKKISQSIKSRKAQVKKVAEETQRQAKEEMDEMHRMQKEFDDRIRDEHSIREQQKKSERKKVPYLEEGGYYIGQDGKYYYNYDGINVETGDFLRIRQLNKVCKNSEGRYLYTAIICNVANETDGEFIDNSVGVPVCFTIDKRVTDIMNDYQPQEIQNFLALLSQEENFRNNNGTMNFIGALDRNGNISKTENSRSFK